MQHGAHGFTSLPKEGVLRIFFARKNPTASAGFEPAFLGTKGQHVNNKITEAAIFLMIYHLKNEGCVLSVCQIFRTDAVKIIKLTIRPNDRHHLRSSSLLHVDTG